MRPYIMAAIVMFTYFVWCKAMYTYVLYSRVRLLARVPFLEILHTPRRIGSLSFPAKYHPVMNEGEYKAMKKRGWIAVALTPLLMIIIVGVLIVAFLIAG